MKRGLKTLVTGILLFLAGVFVVPIAIILPVILDHSDDRQFIIPGSTGVYIEEPGRYYLWNDFRTVFDGKSYNRSECIPDGLEIAISNEAGENFEFSSNASITSTRGSNSKNSIGFVELDAPGKMTVSVSGASDERVFSFSKSSFKELLGLIFGGIGLSMLLALAGLAVSVWGIIKLSKPCKNGHAAHPTRNRGRTQPAEQE